MIGKFNEIPTLEQVIEFGKTIKVSESLCKTFFDDYSIQNWRGNEGIQVPYWKLSLIGYDIVEKGQVSEKGF